MNKKYIIRLTAQEREELETLTKKGKTQAYRIKHAHILLAVDADGPNWPDHHVAKAYKCHQNTVRNVRQRFVEQGLEAALGDVEARLITIACSTPPEGYAKWTMQMLADELVALHVVESVSSQTVWRALKKTNLNLT